MPAANILFIGLLFNRIGNFIGGLLGQYSFCPWILQQGLSLGQVIDWKFLQIPMERIEGYALVFNPICHIRQKACILKAVLLDGGCWPEGNILCHILWRQPNENPCC